MLDKDKLRKIIDLAHGKEAEQIIKELESNKKTGLSPNEVINRQKIFSKNIVKTYEPKSILFILWNQINNPFSYILIFALVLSVLFFSVIDAFIIFLALIVNIAIGAYQEKKADKIFNNLASFLKQKVTVLRNSQKIQVDTSELVPGDIVFLNSGEKVPADLKIIDAHDLILDESSITGEAEAKHKRSGKDDVDTTLQERKTILYSGSNIIQGTAVAVVFATGKDSFFGQIADMSDNAYKDSPTIKRMRKISKIVLYIVTFFVVLGAVFAYIHNLGLKEAALLLIALSVASVPEGLPAAVAVSLAVGMQSILKRGGLVKSNNSAETLGFCDFILSDKTGTITSGKMNLKYTVRIDDLDSESFNVYKDALIIASLASDAEIIQDKNENLTVKGRPIEKAILEKALEFGINKNTLFTSGFERLELYPFSSQKRFAASLNSDPELGKRVYFTGAPETLIEISSYILEKDGVIAFDNDGKLKIQKAIELLSRQGYRITAVAYADDPHVFRFLKENRKISKSRVVFAYLMVFEDEIRREVKDAVLSAKDMGVDTLMVTGDYPQTALAIAKRVGISNEDGAVITGKDFGKMSDSDIFAKIKNGAKVFARMLPEQKLRLVRILQSRGQKVAMTGDGINDAPALSFADIGIAVESGTAIAKDAADMILLKNSFAVIKNAILEGRRIAQNIYKIIVYMLSTSVGELSIVIIALAFGNPAPLLPKQLLWHNIVEGGFMNFPFAFDKEYYKERFSRIELEKKVYKLLAFVSLYFATSFIVLYFTALKYTESLEHLRVVMFLTLSVSGLAMAFSFRSFTKPVWKVNHFQNKVFVWSVTLNMILLVLAFIFEPLRNALSLITPDLLDITLVVIFLFASIFVVEFLKRQVFK